MELAIAIDKKSWFLSGFGNDIQEKISRFVGEETAKCWETFPDLLPIKRVSIELRLSRAHSFLGQMTIKPTSGKKSLSGLMKLSAGLIGAGDEAEIRGVIMHELLHLLPGGGGHQGVWRARADVLNTKYGYDLQRCGKSHGWSGSREQNRFLLTCKVCGQKYYYKRFSRNVKYYRQARCGRCGGELKLDVLITDGGSD